MPANAISQLLSWNVDWMKQNLPVSTKLGIRTLNQHRCSDLYILVVESNIQEDIQINAKHKVSLGTFKPCLSYKRSQIYQAMGAL